MKIYGDPTSNLIRNSTPSSTLEFTSFSQGLPISSFEYQTGANGAGQDGFVRYTSTAGGTATGFMGFIYGVGTTAVVKPGDKVIFSAYVRPSVTANLAFQFEGREALMGVNVGWSISSSGNALVECPANVWTRLSVVGTVNSIVNGPGFMVLRPYLLGVTGTTYPAGFTYDISSLMLNRGDTLIDFFNGNSSGCSWSTTPGFSISYKNANLQNYTAPGVFVSRTTYNEILNPCFANGTNLAPLWSEYKVLSSVGSFSKDLTNQTVTATSIPAGGAFGINATNSTGGELIPMQVPIVSGSNLVYRVNVNKSGLASGTSVNVRTEFYGSDGTTLVGSNTSTSSVTTGSQFLSGFVRNITGAAHYVKFYLYISAASNFTGSSSVLFSNAGVLWVFDYGYDVSIAGDGTFTGNSSGNMYYSAGWWLGNADESKSAATIKFAKEVSGKVKVRSDIQNTIIRPNFLSAWGGYSTATSVGTRTYDSGVLTIKATELSSGGRRYGVSNGAINPRLGGATLKGGQWYMTMRITVDATNLVPGTTAIFYTDLRNGSAYVASMSISIPAGTVGDLYLKSLIPVDITNTETFIWINPTTGTDWTGSTELKVSKAMLVFHKDDINVPYFDGDSSGAFWNRASGASRSMLPAWSKT